MKHNRPRQHVRKLKTGKKILVNRGVSKRIKVGKRARKMSARERELRSLLYDDFKDAEERRVNKNLAGSITTPKNSSGDELVVLSPEQKERQLSRIQKLQRLAGPPPHTEPEKISANAKAQELLAKYNLSEEDIEDDFDEDAFIKNYLEDANRDIAAMKAAEKSFDYEEADDGFMEDKLLYEQDMSDPRFAAMMKGLDFERELERKRRNNT